MFLLRGKKKDVTHPRMFMSRWRDFIEEESEHQWLSFAVFAIVIIVGAILIDWSNELSGVNLGSNDDADGKVLDVAGGAILYDTENGREISLNGESAPAPYATCLERHAEIVYACLGMPGVIYVHDEGDENNPGWQVMILSENVTVIDIAGNGDALLMIVQDGTSTTLAAMFLTPDVLVSPLTSHDNDMHLTAIVPTSTGWLVGGGWKAPPSFLGSNPTSPPMYEMILDVVWDGSSAPSIEIIHLGGEGLIHTIMPTSDGFIAAGTSDSVHINGKEVTSLGIASQSATVDMRGDVWFFGELGSTNVAIYSNEEISIEKLPDPLHITPEYSVIDDSGTIAIHGVDSNDEISSLSIDTDARLSFTSLRGMMDLGFILVSLMIISLMMWNVVESIRTGEEF